MRKIIADSILAAAALIAASSCVDDGDFVTALGQVPDASGTTRSVVFDCGSEFSAGTRSILGDDVDGICSGGTLAVYDASTGRLDSQYVVEDLSRPFSLEIPVGKKNFYMLANLWYISTEDGSLVPWTFPAHESDVSSMTYRMNGTVENNGTKRENFSKVGTYGIPMAGKVKGVNVASTDNVSISLERLFSKVTITVDHAGLDGGVDPDFFRNGKLYMRQANCKLKPFASSSRASSSTDIMKTSDYVSSMENATSTAYVFYVPENVQGVLMPDNTDPSAKDMDGVAAAGYADRQPYLTYAEFTGTVNSAAGGFGGTVTYRFFLGEDSTGDFTVARNREYRIHLGFKVGSLFEPDWKLDVGSDWSDTRRISLSADSKGQNLLPEGQVIAVRKSRAGTCYLYYNKTGAAGKNQYSLLTRASGPYEASDLSDAAWFLEAPGLADCGISASVSGNKISFKVSSGSKFSIGKDIPVRLHLYPGDITYDAVVRTYDDIAVEEVAGQSLTEGFYTGMKRTLKFRGLAGSKVYYWNAGTQGIQCLKDSPQLDGGWISSTRSEEQCVLPSSNLSLYAYSPGGGNGFRLHMVTDDEFNDGVVYDGLMTVSGLTLRTVDTEVSLPISGDEKSIAFRYEDENGNTMKKSLFDSVVYSQILAPHVVVPSTLGSWVRSDSNKLWIQNLSTLDGSIVTMSQNGGQFGAVSLAAHDMAGARCVGGAVVKVPVPYWTKKFATSIVTDYYDQYGESGFSNEAEMVTYGLPHDFVIMGNAKGVSSVREENSSPQSSKFTWNFSDETNPDSVPYGDQEIVVFYRNKHTGDAYGLSLSFIVFHQFHLGTFMVFREGSPIVEEISLTTAKNAFLRKRYLESGEGSNQREFLGSGGTVWNTILARYYKATGPGISQLMTQYGFRGMYDYMYQDVDNYCYGQATPWTETRIHDYVSAGRTPFLSLSHTGPAPGYAPLQQPISSVYLESNSYLNVTLDNRLVGYAVIK